MGDDTPTQFILVCLPYAGGTANSYIPLSKLLRGRLSIAAVEFPGHGRRRMEVARTSSLQLAREICEAIGQSISGPFAILGHSLGAVLAFETARFLRENSDRRPVRLFLSGRRAPHLTVPLRGIREMNDAAFEDMLRAFGGTPDEILCNPGLMRLLAPALRADFEMSESYVYQAGEPLGCPISVFGGLSDLEVTAEGLAEWARHTTSTCTQRMLPGNHFFIHSAASVIAQHVLSDLAADGAV